MACLFAVSMVGCTNSTVPALALAGHGDRAGSGAGIIGVLTFTLGGVTAPLAGVAGDSLLPLAIVMVVLALGANVAFRTALAVSRPSASA